MMKRFIILTMALLGYMLNSPLSAQDVPTATLQHGNELKVYYGSRAFLDAITDADHGDDITLSAGTFKAGDIEKAVSIHGSGYVNDPENNRLRTVLDGDFNIDLPSETSGFLLEGIYSKHRVYILNTVGATINACRFNSIYFGKTGSENFNSENCLISNSRINYIVLSNSIEKNLCLYNNIISYLGQNNSNSTLHVDHCVITKGGSYNWYVNYDKEDGKVYGLFTNSIIKYPTSNTLCSAFNNVVIVRNFSTLDQKNNIFLNETEANELFESSKIGDNADLDNMDYKLKKFPIDGTDKSQIGIHGGAAPFTDIPGIPQIISKEIAPQTDNEGKLSVKIKVQAN